MELVWTRPAQADRKTIREFIATSNPSAALKIDKLLSDRSTSLINHPGLGRLGRLQGTRELVVHNNYILIYDVVNDLIRVLRVLHAARQWPPIKD
ncbi:type II toxin-antitoxin system RelE/ParE family toxin [Polaromonas vacuolata]|uniref:type II toxin-antitoxin system RelE/ParE family toxin n=1 Tax=Polaromonas vacuolata TaxID=37448 RepID=UPI0014576ACE|nr:type II toxin-antitoxin system RelE/ParE family toxin [Polaromonas vacuolata]